MPLRIVILNENSDPSPLFIVSEHSSFYTFICLLNEEKELAQKKKKNEKNEGINNNNYSWKWVVNDVVWMYECINNNNYSWKGVVNDVVYVY